MSEQDDLSFSPERVAEMTSDQKMDLLLVIGPALVSSVRRLEKSRKWSRVAVGAMALIGTLVLGLVIGLYGTVHYATSQAAKRDAQVACLQDYLNNYAAVALVRSNANAARTDAIDDVFATLPKPGSTRPFDQEAFDRALANQLKASDQYQQTLDDNPLPPAPKVACS